MAPSLEFVGGQRESFSIEAAEVYIGRGAGCALRVDGERAGERHARLTLDGAGNVFIQDLDTHAGTLRNGNFVFGVQQLGDGDEIVIGGSTLRFRGAAPTVAVAATRAGADERTRLPAELPPEVRALLAARQQAAVAAPTVAAARPPQPPPPVEAAPAGIVVGTPEPEPDNFRTVQMAPADLAALGIDPASLPPITRPKPLPPTAAQPTPPTAAQPTPAAAAARRTIVGMPAPLAAAVITAPSSWQAPTASAIGLASTMELPAARLATPPAAPTKLPPPQNTVIRPAPTPPAIVAAAAPSPSMKTAPRMEAPPVAPSPTYTPPAKGAFGSVSRALAFMGQIFTLARRHPALARPLVWDLLLTTPIMAGFTVLGFLVHSRGAFYALMGVEAFVLYLVDYACNALTASLVHDYATTGEASAGRAVPRVRRALPGVVRFAAVSALLDLAATYARERDDRVSRVVLRLIRAVWSTATYVIMPALVIEGLSFGAAFKRSQRLMAHDPTGVGAGVVALSLTSYLVAALFLPLAYLLARAGGLVHPAVGALGAMLVVNLYWSVSGWLKIAYATCFYLWARECERTGTQEHALAPLPLRCALDAG